MHGVPFVLKIILIIFLFLTFLCLNVQKRVKGKVLQSENIDFDLNTSFKVLSISVFQYFSISVQQNADANLKIAEIDFLKILF